MIQNDEVISIGRFTRPHGVKGEMAMTFVNDVFDRTDCPYLVCAMDGILVPFFIEEYRFKSETTALIKFERIDTVEQARIFVNKEVFFPICYLPEDEEPTLSWSTFVGYEASDVTLGQLGTVVDVDDSTVNVLFIVERPDGSEVFIPAQEVFIKDLDPSSKKILFTLPDGLID